MILFSISFFHVLGVSKYFSSHIRMNESHHRVRENDVFFSHYIYNSNIVESFCSLKLYIKNKFMNQIVNNIQLSQNLAYILRT